MEILGKSTLVMKAQSDVARVFFTSHGITGDLKADCSMFRTELCSDHPKRRCTGTPAPSLVASFEVAEAAIPREMSCERCGEPHSSSECASSTARPPGTTGRRRPPHESPGTLRGAPSDSSLTRPRLADMSNIRRCSFTGADTPGSLSRFRGMIEARPEQPGTPAVGIGCANPVVAAPPSALQTETPRALMNALESGLHAHSDGAASFQATPSLLMAVAARSTAGLLAPPTAPVLQTLSVALPPEHRTCSVCLTPQDPTWFKRITVSWRKTAFVLLGRQFPGCFGTTSPKDICALPRASLSHVRLGHD